MSVRVRLRPMRAKDLDRIVELERTLFGRGAWTYGMLADELGGLGRWYIVAEPERPDAAGPQPVIGYAGLWFDGDVTQVMTIGVDPSYQHQHVGSALLEALIDRSRRLAAEAVLLEVRVDNDAALAMYAKYGFTQVGLRKRYYQPEDVDAFTMRLELPAFDEPSIEPEGPGAERETLPLRVEATAADLDAEEIVAESPARSRVLVTVEQIDAWMRPALGEEAVHPVFLDVRWQLGAEDGYEKYLNGHIPGAVFVNLETELAASPSPTRGRHPLPPLEVLDEAVKRWGITSAPVVVYDDCGGMSAARAWWLLRWAGYKQVYILDGGLRAWTDSLHGGALELGEPTLRLWGPQDGPTDGFVVRTGGMPVLDPDGAAELAKTGILLDARAGERYRGESEPIDARAGHIPGAVSAPTTENLDDRGRFLPDDALRARFAALGVPVPEPGSGTDGSDPALSAEAAPGQTAQVGVYCGSGVTAAHEIAALASIGVWAALYPGSWSQWSADPMRPVETGD